MLSPVVVERHFLLSLQRLRVVELVTAILRYKHVAIDSPLPLNIQRLQKPYWEVLARVRSSTLLSVFSAVHSLKAVRHQVLQFERFHQIRIPNESFVDHLQEDCSVITPTARSQRASTMH